VEVGEGVYVAVGGTGVFVLVSVGGGVELGVDVAVGGTGVLVAGEMGVFVGVRVAVQVEEDVGVRV
jgi:hypothetical protein